MRTLLLFCMLIMTSCSEYISDPTRPDIRKQAEHNKKSNLKEFGPE